MNLEILTFNMYIIEIKVLDKTNISTQKNTRYFFLVETRSKIKVKCLKYINLTKFAYSKNIDIILPT